MPAKKATIPKPSASSAKHDNNQLSLIKQLAIILNETGLTEIELDQGGTRVRVSKGQTSQHVTAHAAPMQMPIAAAAPAIAVASSAPTLSTDQAIKSPMVGTCYLASSPEAAPFVAIGTNVKVGQTILIIEAMKTMNQIAATKSGKVTQIFVTNGQPVEYGEALMVIE